MRLPILALPLVLLAACGQIAPSNAFDPGSPPAKQAPGVLEGTVLLADPSADAVELAKELAEVAVTLVDTGGATVLGDDGNALAAALRIDGARGDFSFPRLAPGTYRPSVANVGSRYVPPTIAPAVVAAGATTRIGELVFTASSTGTGPGSLRGTVALEGGQGGARRLTVWRASGDTPELVRSVTTDETGRFEARGLAVGTYAITAELEGFTPDYRLDVKIGETSGASLEQVFDGEDALALHPVTAVLRPDVGSEVREVEGTRYTRSAEIPLVVLAIGGVTDMRVSTRPDLKGADGSEGAWEKYAATTRLALPATEGRIEVYAQFRARTEAGFSFVTPVFSTSVVRDTTPPVVVSATPTGIVPAADGTLWVRTPGVSVPVEIVALDAESAVRGVSVVQPADGLEPASAARTYDLVVSSGGLVRRVGAAALQAGPGDRVAWVHVLDRAGNESAGTALHFRVDDVAPSIASLTIDGGGTHTASSVVSLALERGSDSEEALELAISNGEGFPGLTWVPFAETLTWVLEPGDGARAVYAKVRDAAGNVSDVVHAEVIVDTVAPGAPTVVLAGGALQTSRATVAVALSAQDAERVRVSVDGTFDGSAPGEQWTSTFPTQLTLPGGDGRKSVWAQFTDAAGNASAVAAASIVLDTVAPVFGAVPVAIDAGAAFTRSVSVAVLVDAQGAEEMVFATDGTIDTETWFPFATTSTVLLPAGDCGASQASCKSVCVQVRDAAGNTSATKCDTIGLDTTPPSVPILASTDEVVADRNYTLELAARPAESFFARYELFLEGEDVDFVASPNAVTNLEFDLLLTDPPTTGARRNRSSRNLIRVRAVDLAGNVSAESSVTIIVDTEAPPRPTLAALPNVVSGTSIVNADTVQLNFAKDNEADTDATFSHYEIRAEPLVPEFTPTSAVDGLIFTLVPDALTTLEVRAVDEAGNTSPAASAKVLEDSTDPSAPEISPRWGTVRSSAVEIVVSTPSRDSGKDVTMYEVKGGAGSNFRPVAGSGPFLVPLRGNRENELCVRGRDLAGNVSLEDCAVVQEQSSVELLGSGVGARGSDVTGDSVVFPARGKLWLHDLRDEAPLILSDTEELSPLIGDLDRNGTTDPTGAAGEPAFVRTVSDPRVLRVAYAIEGSNRVGIYVKTLVPNADVDDALGGVQAVAERQVVGSAPDLSGTTLVYFANGQVRSRTLSPLPPLTVNASDFGTALSAANVKLCPGADPRVQGNVAVWCEWVDANANNTPDEGEGTLRRRLIGDSAAPIETLSTRIALAGAGTLTGQGASFQQHVITDRLVAWVAKTTAGPRLEFLRGDITASFVASSVQQAGPFVDSACGTMNLNALEDGSGSLLGFRFVRQEGLTEDVALYDVEKAKATCLTNDLPPQSIVRVDGARVIWRDHARGETVNLADLTRTRWLSANPELSFFPVTSANATAWLETRTDPSDPTKKALSLIARKLPIDQVDSAGTLANKEVVLSRKPVMFGNFEGDGTFAIGGTRVAYFEVGTVTPGLNDPLTLKVVSAADGAAVASVANALVPLAIDPDGTTLVYRTSAGALVRRNADGSGSVATFDSGTDFPTVDVDGEWVVYQRGGSFTDRRSTGKLYGSLNGAAGIDLGVADVRAPKVAKVDAEVWVAFFKDTDPAVNNVSLAPYACRIKGTSCTDLRELSPPNLGERKNLSVSRDGLVAWLSDEELLAEIVLYDLRANRRWWATPVDPVAGERSNLNLAAGRLVWADASLGTLDVWEMDLRR